MSDMTHALLTPPGAARTDLDNLGVFQMVCRPPFVDQLFAAMTDEGWLIAVVDDQPDVPVDWPPRARGQGYVDAFIVAHPDVLIPFEADECCGACGLILSPQDGPHVCALDPDA